jgi:hypothetical protein
MGAKVTRAGLNAALGIMDGIEAVVAICEQAHHLR